MLLVPHLPLPLLLLLVRLRQLRLRHACILVIVLRQGGGKRQDSGGAQSGLSIHWGSVQGGCKQGRARGGGAHGAAPPQAGQTPVTAAAPHLFIIFVKLSPKVAGPPTPTLAAAPPADVGAGAGTAPSAAS